MGKLHVRIDDRLIHGQITTTWAKTWNIERIIAVDNKLADNDMIKDILLMGIPKEFKPVIVKETDAIELLKDETKNVLLITRFAHQLEPLLDAIQHCENVNIGNCSKQSDSIFISKGIGVGQVLSFNQKDVDILDNLVESGVKVEFQQMPIDKAISWSELKKGLKEID